MAEILHVPRALKGRPLNTCLTCRARHIRCNVSKRGIACANCTMDDAICVLPEKGTRGRKYRPQPPKNGKRTQSPDPSKPLKFFQHSIDENKAMSPRVEAAQNTAETSETYVHRGQTVPDGKAQKASDPIDSSIPACAKPCPSNREPKADKDKALELMTPVMISHRSFPFVAVYNLSHSLPRDINHMTSKGCFHLPTRAILDHFVKQYFLHVHPLLPLLNEASFWKTYSCQHRTGEAPLSLLVMQAMMFASSAFIPTSWVRALGFESLRSARAAFYKRAKLLYDFGTEQSPVAKAQAALMLSSWIPPSNIQVKENTLWLTIAIQNARSAGADESARHSPLLWATPAENKHRNILKRLWWCCIIRDRIMPLGLRRSIQITYAHFDFSTAPRLGLWDLEDEVQHSRVYDAKTKRYLIEILEQVVNLCVVLTDVLLLMFPVHGLFGLRRDPCLEQTRIHESKGALQRWKDGAMMKTGSPAGGVFQSESAILNNNLMCIYYESARVPLCHYELTRLVAAPGVAIIDNSRLYEIQETRREIQRVVSRMNESLEVLHRLNLMRWLPINMVAYTAFPLALHTLDMHLSGSYQLFVQQSRTKNSPGIFIEAIQILHQQYDGVDWMASIVRSAVRTVQQCPALSRSDFKTWTDILVFQPRRYLQLSIILDLGLRVGSIPSKDDIPTNFKDMLNIELKWSFVRLKPPQSVPDDGRRGGTRLLVEKEAMVARTAIAAASLTCPEAQSSSELDGNCALADQSTTNEVEQLALEGYTELSTFSPRNEADSDKSSAYIDLDGMTMDPTDGNGAPVDLKLS